MGRTNCLLAVLFYGLLLAAGCTRTRGVRSEMPQDPRVSVVYVGAPAAVTRLVRGFNGTDNPYWRWAERNSSIIMNTPRDAHRRGAVLVLHFAIVEVVLARVKSQSLFATVAGIALPVQHYDKPGQFTLRQDVPASALQFDPVRVDFTVDKALPSTRAGQQEHAIIISHVELVAK